MSTITTVAQADLTVDRDNKSRWTRAEHRRYGLHNLHRIARYGMSFRAARVLPLEKRLDVRIAQIDCVRHLTSVPWFSAMVVMRGQHVLFERYATDFGPDAPHSIQSITKTTMNLVIGQLVERRTIDLARTVQHYIPEIGSGYAAATLQQVMNMDVANDYSEDFADPAASYYRHEEAMGWRLPADPQRELTQRQFIAGVASRDTRNHEGYLQYKDANTDVAGWAAERASGRPLRAFLADIVDAAGLESTFYITTDREGFPTLDGGACCTARDLARYFSLFVRGGRGVNDESVGSAAFIEQTLVSGVPKPPPRDWMRYSNHFTVAGRLLGHGGWAGQYALANLVTGTVGVFLSAIEDQHGDDRDYIMALFRMLEAATSLGP